MKYEERKSLKMILILIVFIVSNLSFAQNKRKYKYREVEKQNSNIITINVGDGGLGGLTIDDRLRKEYGNTLPEREDFKPEVRRSIRRVK